MRQRAVSIQNRYAFWSLQHLADKYNVQIVRIYGAAGHGIGLIDAMSSFGVNPYFEEISFHSSTGFRTVEKCATTLPFMEMLA